MGGKRDLVSLFVLSDPNVDWLMWDQTHAGSHARLMVLQSTVEIHLLALHSVYIFVTKTHITKSSSGISL